MKTNRIAMLALLIGFVTCSAYGQYDRRGAPPGGWGRDSDYGDDEDSWNRQSDDDYDYDRDQAPETAVGFFYDELSPYGEWIRHPRYGWAWFPRHVNASWRPYSRGRWVETDYGWTWVSREPFGWATYHYGRWAWDRRVGWLWVPGTDWGPAWVSWQQGNGYVGWAPLPPAVGFEIGFGIRLGSFNLDVGIAPRDYTFVEERRFLDSSVGNWVLPQARNGTIIRNTSNITNYTVVGDRVVNHGVPIERIEQATGRTAPRLRVTTTPTPGVTSVQRNQVRVYRPAAGKLESVQVARRNNAGLPPVAPRPNRVEPQAAPPPTRVEQQAPPPAPPAVVPIRPAVAPAPIPVAPRARLAPRTIDESQFVREQRELKASQEKERRTLEQIHRQEMTQGQAKANAQELAQRHAAELQAQQELRQRSEQQLQTRQQLQRQAAQASPPTVQKVAPKPSVERGKPTKQQKEKKDDDKKGDEKKPVQVF